MKKLLLTIAIITMSTTFSVSQVFDSLTVINSEYGIEGLAWKGDDIFAAVGEGGVMYSSDEGYTWNETSELPDAGFGQEAANSIFVASNGDLIVGGNLNYNGAALGGVVFRSSDNGIEWTAEPFEGLAGYEKSKKIIELPNGDLMMHGGQTKLFTSSLSNNTWTQITAPGGVIFGFEVIGNEVFVVTNPSAGTAGTWVTSDLGASWQLYGGNGTPVSGGTVTIAPILNTTNYKYIGIGGSYGLKGVFRSGINDTLWVESNNGIDNFGVYPICMATDNQTIWMVFQSAGGGCYFTSTYDFANNWEEPVMGLPQQGVGGPCIRMMMVFKTHLYTFANNSIYRIADVAAPNSVSEQNIVEKEIKVYPNPGNGQINFEFTLENRSDVKLNITDLTGQVVFKQNMHSVIQGKKKVTIDLSELKSGLYIVTLLSDEGIGTSRISIIN